MKAYFRRLILPLLERNLSRLIAAHELKVVAVAGSVGKTSTKIAVAEVLAQKYRVMVHPGNYNDAMSVPVAAFGLEMPGSIINPLAWLIRLIQMEARIVGRFDYDVLVLELGTDHPGEIPRFMRYLRPDVGIVTAVAPEHMEFFKTIDAVAAEELALGSGSRTLLVNADSIDEKWLARNTNMVPLNSRGRRRAYGSGQMDDLVVASNGRDVRITGGHVGVSFASGLVGRPALLALAAAYGAGDALGLTKAELAAGLAAVTAVPGRMQQLDGRDGAVIIDDTYNSSPEAVAAALATLQDWVVPAGGRRIAILGSMNELGDEAVRYHREAGAAAYAAGVDLLVTIGGLANRELGPAAVAAGMDPASVKPADSPYAAGEFVASLLRPGDVVLAKGSQNGVFAEEAVKLLLADPADASRLVRQSGAWLAKKRAQFKA